MATVSQPAPLAGDSLLEKLPPELLEKILLEVVSDITPPSEYTLDNSNILRCELEEESGISLASLLLEHRLVSRTIRNSSWRSLARVLGETVFDMCSKESMENLIALTGCTGIAPWIHKLTVSCFKVNKTYPFCEGSIQDEEDYEIVLSHLGTMCRTDVSRLRDMDETWYNNAWTSPIITPKVSSFDSDQPGINLEFQQGLKYTVSACLSRLTNLDNIYYYYDTDHVPARFREFAHRYKTVSDFDFSIAPEYHSEVGADLGFRLLMDIMSTAKLQPKRLCLAVVIEDPQYFLTSTWTATNCLHRVEELTLIDPGVVPRVWERPSSTISAVPISKANFPQLFSFSTELRRFPFSPPLYASPPPPRVLDMPELRHLSITGGHQASPQLLKFLGLLKGTIQSVSLRDMQSISYEPILKVLRSLKLDVLAIHDEHDQWWEGDTYDEREFRGVPKGFLDSIAKSGSFGPEVPEGELEE